MCAKYRKGHFEGVLGVINQLLKAIKAKYMGYKVDEVGIHSFPSNFRAGSSIVLKNILITIRDIFILFYKIYITNKINNV